MMNGKELLFIFVAWVIFLTVIYFLTKQATRLYQTRMRLLQAKDDSGSKPQKKKGFFERLRIWLAGAGYEKQNAVFVYLTFTFVAIAVGVLSVFLLFRSELIPSAQQELSKIPGSIGDIFSPVINLAPYIVFFIAAMIPWLFVRSRRRKRIESINQDLPVFLEFLVTLSEAGLGFDEAMGRILEVYDERRPIVYGFQGFQKSVMAGSARIHAFWQLRERLQTSGVRKLISALIQGEQTGGRMGEILRNQAEDILSHRRMRALELASSLPVKLLFPMLVCFLPGIFIATLGPVFYQFIEVMDTVIRSMS